MKDAPQLLHQVIWSNNISLHCHKKLHLSDK